MRAFPEAQDSFSRTYTMDSLRHSAVSFYSACYGHRHTQIAAIRGKYDGSQDRNSCVVLTMPNHSTYPFFIGYGAWPNRL